MDRRRRAIREGLVAAGDQSDEARVSPSRTAKLGIELPELTKKDRGVAYSHSVRRACQHRLVQFIPVRKLSLSGAIAASVAVPMLLMALHYLVFVSGSLNWARHPMSALLNANSPRSLAAWLSSHLWLLCLAATVFTFRLRKHKLDDYEGEYRLWFWLVFTCVIGSIDSTTRLTELFGAALDRWSQLHVGWTGGAIVQATLATLVGMLGLRLCSELKTVPASLVMWLVGLSCWAGSAALSQSMLRIDISAPMRDWLRASLWLGGLTSIWLSGLLFLRSVFMEAQQRFLARSIMAGASGVPWRERLSQAMPQMPRFGRRDADQSEPESGDQAASVPRRKKSAVAASATPADALNGNGDKVIAPAQTSGLSGAPPKRRWGLGGLTLRPPTAAAASTNRQVALRGTDSEVDDADEQRGVGNASAASQRSQAAQADEVEREYGKRPNWFRRRTQTTENSAVDSGSSASASARTSTVKPAPRIKVGRSNGEEDAIDGAPAKRTLRDRLQWKTKAVTDGAQASVKPRRNPSTRQAGDDSEAAPTKRSWLRLPKPRMPKVSLPKPRLPKLKMPSFKLPPPKTSADAESQSDASRVPSASSRPVPNTSGPIAFRPNLQNQDNDADNGRGMSKAERKRLKRMQRDDDGSERRAA